MLELLCELHGVKELLKGILVYVNALYAINKTAASTRFFYAFLIQSMFCTGSDLCSLVYVVFLLTK